VESHAAACGLAVGAPVFQHIRKGGSLADSRQASAAMVSRYTPVEDAWGNSPLNAVGV
jgi:hypothetical protein